MLLYCDSSLVILIIKISLCLQSLKLCRIQCRQNFHREKLHPPSASEIPLASTWSQSFQYHSSAQGFGPKMHSFVLPCSILSLFVQQQMISVPSSVLPASEAVLLCRWHLISKSHLILLEHQILHTRALWAFFTKRFL